MIPQVLSIRKAVLLTIFFLLLRCQKDLIINENWVRVMLRWRSWSHWKWLRIGVIFIEIVIIGGIVQTDWALYREMMAIIGVQILQIYWWFTQSWLEFLISKSIDSYLFVFKRACTASCSSELRIITLMKTSFAVCSLLPLNRLSHNIDSGHLIIFKTDSTSIWKVHIERICNYSLLHLLV